jgi:hypothetical protein
LVIYLHRVQIPQISQPTLKNGLQKTGSPKRLFLILFHPIN